MESTVSSRFAPCTLVAIATLCMSFGQSAYAADDWPGFRGVDLDGKAPHAADLFEGEHAGLAHLWRFEVGSGYSAIAVADGKVIALGSDGDQDIVTAIDGGRGQELWRAPLGSMTKGHDGSEDGPLATPAIADGRIFVYGGDGTLHAFALEDGRSLWTASPNGGAKPFYNHSASPLAVGGLVVVSRGTSDEGTLVAHDAATGTVRWTAAPGEAEYQSPIVATFAGQQQIVFWLKEQLVGIDLEGQELWSVVAPANDDASPVVIDANGLLLGGGRASTAIDLNRDEDGSWSSSERWSSRKLKPSMSSVVVHGDHLYGFDRNFLTALNAKTGDVAWKSRPPGGSGIVVIGDRLAIFAKDGDLVLAKASPDGYQEEARLRATDHGSLTWPAFADGTLFVRDKKHVAAIRVTDQQMVLTEAEPALISGTRFAEFINKAKASSQPKIFAEHLLRTTDSFPIREGGIVHFVFHGNNDDVGLSGNWLGFGNEHTLERLEGTNLFYRSLAIDPTIRLEYGYRLDFEQVALDPLNPRFLNSPWDQRSVLAARDSTVPPYLAPYEGSRAGKIESFTLKSNARNDEREIEVYIPGVVAATPRLLVVPHGPQWLGSGQLANSLDHLIDSGVLPPTVIAFVAPAAKMAFTEDDGANTPATATLLAEELVPEIQQRYGTSKEPAHTVVLGNDWHVALAAFAAVEYPEVFGSAILLSRPGVSEWNAAIAEKAAAATLADSRFYLAWNQLEPPQGSSNAAEQTQQLADILRNAGRTVLGGERIDSSGWGAYRVAAIEGLLALLGDG